MYRFASFILSYRWWFLASLIGLTAFLGWNIKHIRTDNSIEVWLNEDDPGLSFYNSFKKDFGGEEFILIVIDSEKIFTKEAIGLINQITSEINSVEGVAGVISLATILKDKMGQPYFKRLLAQNGALSPSARRYEKVSSLEIFKQDLLSDPLYVNNIISMDGKTTAIMVMIKGERFEKGKGPQQSKNGQNWSEYRKGLVKEVKEIVANGLKRGQSASTQYTGSPLYQSIYIAGPSVVNAELDRMSQEDLAKFVPIMFLVAIVVLVALFRKVSGVALPVAVIVISNIWTIGLFAVCGNTMNMVSGIITPVIFVISMSMSIHIINHFYSEGNSILNSIKDIGLPCLLNNLTTAIGFLSFVSSDVSPVRITGIYTGAGIMISFFICAVLLIIVFSIRRGKDSGTVAGNPLSVDIAQPLTSAAGPVSRNPGHLLHKINRFISNHRWHILIFNIVLVGASIYGISRLNVESDIMKSFPEKSEIRVANEHIERRLTGLLPLEIVIHINNGSIFRRNILDRIDRFQGYLRGISDVTFSLSVVDFIKKANMTINNGESQYFKIPESDEKALQYAKTASLYGDSIINSFYSQDETSARISLRMKQVGSNRYRGLVNQIREYIDKNLSDGLRVNITGVVHLLIEMQDYLLMSQIKSFSLAFVVIFVAIIFLLRSFKLGLISIVPNIMPVLFTLGAMGYIGIRLDAGTIMIASVAIGIAVDDTIHFLYRYKKEFNRLVSSNHESADPYVRAVELTLLHVGKAMVFTSVVAFCGFMALCLSSFKPVQYFGLLTAITMASALVVDLFLTPCCLLILRPKIYT